MSQEVGLRRSRLTTPRAAAVPGVLFSVLLIAAFVLLGISVPADPHDEAAWLAPVAIA